MVHLAVLIVVAVVVGSEVCVTDAHVNAEVKVPVNNGAEDNFENSDVDKVSVSENMSISSEDSDSGDGDSDAGNDSGKNDDENDKSDESKGSSELKQRNQSRGVSEFGRNESVKKRNTTGSDSMKDSESTKSTDNDTGRERRKSRQGGNFIKSKKESNTTKSTENVAKEKIPPKPKSDKKNNKKRDVSDSGVVQSTSDDIYIRNEDLHLSRSLKHIILDLFSKGRSKAKNWSSILDSLRRGKGDFLPSESNNLLAITILMDSPNSEMSPVENKTSQTLEIIVIDTSNSGAKDSKESGIDGRGTTSINDFSTSYKPWHNNYDSKLHGTTGMKENLISNNMYNEQNLSETSRTAIDKSERTLSDEFYVQGKNLINEQASNIYTGTESYATSTGQTDILLANSKLETTSTNEPRPRNCFMVATEDLKRSMSDDLLSQIALRPNGLNLVLKDNQIYAYDAPLTTDTKGFSAHILSKDNFKICTFLTEKDLIKIFQISEYISLNTNNLRQRTSASMAESISEVEEANLIKSNNVRYGVADKESRIFELPYGSSEYGRTGNRFEINGKEDDTTVHFEREFADGNSNANNQLSIHTDGQSLQDNWYGNQMSIHPDRQSTQDNWYGKLVKDKNTNSIKGNNQDNIKTIQPKEHFTSTGNSKETFNGHWDNVADRGWDPQDFSSFDNNWYDNTNIENITIVDPAGNYGFKVSQQTYGNSNRNGNNTFVYGTNNKGVGTVSVSGYNTQFEDFNEQNHKTFGTFDSSKETLNDHWDNVADRGWNPRDLSSFDNIENITIVDPAGTYGFKVSQQTYGNSNRNGNNPFFYGTINKGVGTISVSGYNTQFEGCDNCDTAINHWDTYSSNSPKSVNADTINTYDHTTNSQTYANRNFNEQNHKTFGTFDSSKESLMDNGDVSFSEWYVNSDMKDRIYNHDLNSFENTESNWHDQSYKEQNTNSEKYNQNGIKINNQDYMTGSHSMKYTGINNEILSNVKETINNNIAGNQCDEYNKCVTKEGKNRYDSGIYEETMRNPYDTSNAAIRTGDDSYGFNSYNDYYMNTGNINRVDGYYEDRNNIGSGNKAANLCMGYECGTQNSAISTGSNAYDFVGGNQNYITSNPPYIITDTINRGYGDSQETYNTNSGISNSESIYGNYGGNQDYMTNNPLYGTPGNSYISAVERKETGNGNKYVNLCEGYNCNTQNSATGISDNKHISKVDNQNDVWSYSYGNTDAIDVSNSDNKEIYNDRPSANLCGIYYNCDSRKNAILTNDNTYGIKRYNQNYKQSDSFNRNSDAIYGSHGYNKETYGSRTVVFLCSRFRICGTQNSNNDGTYGNGKWNDNWYNLYNNDRTNRVNENKNNNYETWGNLASRSGATAGLERNVFPMFGIQKGSNTPRIPYPEEKESAYLGTNVDLASVREPETYLGRRRVQSGGSMTTNHGSMTYIFPKGYSLKYSTVPTKRPSRIMRVINTGRTGHYSKQCSLHNSKISHLSAHTPKCSCRHSGTKKSGRIMAFPYNLKERSDRMTGRNNLDIYSGARYVSNKGMKPHQNIGEKRYSDETVHYVGEDNTIDAEVVDVDRRTDTNPRNVIDNKRNLRDISDDYTESNISPNLIWKMFNKERIGLKTSNADSNEHNLNRQGNKILRRELGYETSSYPGVLQLATTDPKDTISNNQQLGFEKPNHYTRPVSEDILSDAKIQLYSDEVIHGHGTNSSNDITGMESSYDGTVIKDVLINTDNRSINPKVETNTNNEESHNFLLDNQVKGPEGLSFFQQNAREIATDTNKASKANNLSGNLGNVKYSTAASRSTSIDHANSIEKSTSNTFSTVNANS